MWVWRQFKSLYEYFILYAGLLFFVLICLVSTLPAFVIHSLLPRKRRKAMGQFAIMAVFRCFLFVVRISGLVKCDLGALETLRHERSMIITTNHPSMIDVVLIASQLPHIVCIMKAQVVDNLALGIGARMAGYIRNDSPGNLVKLSAAAIKEGAQLLIFPEGTRTQTQPVNDFKGGFALVAKKTGAPVQTVFIEASSQFLGKGWPLLKKPEFPLVYRVRLGERFEVTDDVKTFVADLEAYYRRELQTQENSKQV